MSTSLSTLTTLRLGGPARRLIEAETDAAIIDAVREADRNREPVVILGGGSNVVVADSGFPGTVVRALTRGHRFTTSGERVLVEAGAGESWDDLVARTVTNGLSGMECLSGIPGSAGATPIQNVGAYGQDVSECIVAVRVYERGSERVYELDAQACGFSYRSSVFKRDPARWVVLAVRYALKPASLSAPIRYAELARELGVKIGGRAPLDEVRSAVLTVRQRKGMVLDARDPDSVSAGSFFTNPIVTAAHADTISHSVESGTMPCFPQPDGTVKLSAAWLIQSAGFERGQGDPDGIAISSKHVLALTNRGHGTTRDLVDMASRIVGAVDRKFGVALEPEPVFLGIEELPCLWGGTAGKQHQRKES